MRKITFYCDRCGNLIEQEVHQIGTRFLDSEGLEMDHEYGAELCPACFREIDDMVAFMVKNPTIHFDGGKQIKPKSEPKRTNIHHGIKQNRKGLDLGKMAALRNAGWSYRKIADEMGCSDVTVAAHMEEAQEFLRKQNMKEDLGEALENDLQEA